MDGPGTGIPPTERLSDEDLVLELERFAWAAPDQLEVVGRFVGSGEAPPGQPSLVVRGSAGPYRLPAVGTDQSRPSSEDNRWHAGFRWQEAPVAFDSAELHLGPDLVIELPSPDAEAPSGVRPILRPRANPASGDRETEELVDLRAVLGRTEKELEAARAELDEIRRLRMSEAEQFRTGLAAVQATAEDALAVEQQAAREIQMMLSEARERIAATDMEVRRLQQALDESADTHRQAEAEARLQIYGLRSQLEEARRDAQASRARLDAAEAAASQARDDGRAMADLVSRIREAMDGPV